MMAPLGYRRARRKGGGVASLRWPHLLLARQHGGQSHGSDKAGSDCEQQQ